MGNTDSTLGPHPSTGSLRTTFPTSLSAESPRRRATCPQGGAALPLGKSRAVVRHPGRAQRVWCNEQSPFR